MKFAMHAHVRLKQARQEYMAEADSIEVVLCYA